MLLRLRLMQARKHKHKLTALYTDANQQPVSSVPSSIKFIIRKLISNALSTKLRVHLVDTVGTNTLFQ